MPEFAQEMMAVLQAGGILMLALAALAFTIYWVALDTLARLRQTTRNGLAEFHERVKALGTEGFELDSLTFFHERKTLLQVLTTTAPLLGLLGTVMGMLSTFSGLADSRGDMFDQVAAGISEAMITTETGLIIAIPALFLLMFIEGRIRLIETELNKIEITSKP